MQGAEAGVGCVGSRPQGSWSCQCLVVLQSSGCTVPAGALERGQSLVLANAGTGHVWSVASMALGCFSMFPCCFACALPLAKALGCWCPEYSTTLGFAG